MFVCSGAGSDRRFRADITCQSVEVGAEEVVETCPAGRLHGDVPFGFHGEGAGEELHGVAGDCVGSFGGVVVLDEGVDFFHCLDAGVSAVSENSVMCRWEGFCALEGSQRILEKEVRLEKFMSTTDTP